MKNKVLVIEPLKDLRFVLGGFLKNCGFEMVIPALMTPMDIKMIVLDQKEGLVGVIIGDDFYSIGDGHLAVHCVREVNPDIPILALSDKADVVEQMMSAGASSFLIKPFLFETFAEKIKHLIAVK